MAEKTDRSGMGRRSFLAGAMAATVTIIKPELVRGAKANSTVELGLIGCGGRGRWIEGYFQKHGGYKWVACADYFPQRAQAFAKAHKIPAARCHSTLSGYKKLLEGKLDAVVIETPPYFHPEQAAAAIDAGRHVYVAKPIAVDVPGCMTIGEAGKKATKKKLVFHVDFQTRNNSVYREAAKRVLNGDIGRLVCGEAHYHAGRLGKQGSPAGPEGRLRNWVFDKALSGDIIVEQNIHALDVASWLIDAEPVKAFGTGGRKVRVDVGDCWDHFLVTYFFPKDLLLDFSSTQFLTGFGDIHCRMYGSRGTIDTHYGGDVWIRGASRMQGKTGSIFASGANNNVKDFHKYITEGDCTNATVAPSVRSNLTCVLGREAAYKGDVVTWDGIMKAKTKVDGKLQGLKS
ncbi:MAG: Gfo/Idh/MocA family oxidoreductase [Phycisphaerae bacterium]|nr:Gfo/Idh/MocA family oxidoreductase [Phycisphaerae bacterium]